MAGIDVLFNVCIIQSFLNKVTEKNRTFEFIIINYYTYLKTYPSRDLANIYSDLVKKAVTYAKLQYENNTTN